MHFEPPETPLRTLKEFASHYAMIVVSILTALALEGMALSWEHGREGRQARAEIEQEIAANEAEISEALALTRRNAQQWRGLLQRVADDEKAGRGTDASRTAILREAKGAFADAIPSLKSTAWDAAIASHAVTYLPHAELARFSEIYTSQGVFSASMWAVLRDGALRQISAIELATTTGTADAKETLELLSGRITALQVIESDLAQLDAVFKGRPHDPAR
jgi:hypothetical protein